MCPQEESKNVVSNIDSSAYTYTLQPIVIHNTQLIRISMTAILSIVSCKTPALLKSVMFTSHAFLQAQTWAHFHTRVSVSCPFHMHPQFQGNAQAQMLVHKEADPYNDLSRRVNKTKGKPPDSPPSLPQVIKSVLERKYKYSPLSLPQGQYSHTSSCVCFTLRFFRL